MKSTIKSAIIGGSSGFQFIIDRRGRLERLGTFATPFGDSAAVYRGEIDGLELLFLSRHGEHGYNTAASFVNYRANIWALKDLGVERIVAWSGPAAIDPEIKIGEVVVPGDIIDETRRRDYTFFDGLGLGFIRQNPVFCPVISDALACETSQRFGDCRTDDVYVCTEGPRLETPAEIRKYAMNGATLVGMTLIPEVFLAKEFEMCYAAICYTTNYAEGVRKRSFEPGVLFEGLLDSGEKEAVDSGVAAAGEIAISALASVLESDRNQCACSRQMERYRRRGDIGEDWREWIQRKS